MAIATGTSVLQLGYMHAIIAWSRLETFAWMTISSQSSHVDSEAAFSLLWLDTLKRWLVCEVWGCGCACGWVWARSSYFYVPILAPALVFLIPECSYDHMIQYVSYIWVKLVEKWRTKASTYVHSVISPADYISIVGVFISWVSQSPCIVHCMSFMVKVTMSERVSHGSSKKIERCRFLLGYLPFVTSEWLSAVVSGLGLVPSFVLFWVWDPSTFQIPTGLG